MHFFDSCTHPVLNGTWIGGGRALNHLQLAEFLHAQGVRKAFAIGLPGVGDYSHKDFFAACRSHKSLIPVAALTTVESISCVKRDLDDIVSEGYRCVKIHPRLLGYEKCLTDLGRILQECCTRDLRVLLCTYPESRSAIEPHLARRIMVDAISHQSRLRIVALHGGVLDPAPFTECAAGNPDVLIDFSFSLVRYPREIAHSFKLVAREYPNSICIGSDSPEFSPRRVRQCLADLIQSRPLLESIYWNNLALWWGED